MEHPSLWNRINPFHARPPSSARGRFTPVNGDGRPSTSLETRTTDSRGKNDSSSLEEPTEGFRDGYTPIPDFHAKTISSPSKTRAPSILRSLAHHPSLSAMRSKSKRQSKQKARSPIPPLPQNDQYDHFAKSPLPSFDLGTRVAQVQMEQSPSPKKRLMRKGSLKGSKSLPRDLRLSQDLNVRSSGENDPYPPLPKAQYRPPLPSELYKRSVTPQHASRTPQARSTSSRATRRKPVPSPTPSIAIHHPNEVTPESVRMRRVRFQFDFSVGERSPEDTSPRNKLRKRAASHSEIQDASPVKSPSSSPVRHLSSPPQSSPRRSYLQYTANYHPFTTQHPHPVPLPRPFPKTVYHDSDDTDFFGSGGDDYPNGPDDFVPLTTSGRTIELDDGLDILVKDEQLPGGTPGGTREDLRRGVLMDARHGKNAIRFFSRDMYGSGSTSSHSASSSFLPVSGRQSASTDSAGRSSSPFEVKLSPMVTKRMSLDAFGAPIPGMASPASVKTTNTANGMEHLAEADEDGDEHDSENQQSDTSLVDSQNSASGGDHEVEGKEIDQEGESSVEIDIFRRTTLSTIRETPSSIATQSVTSSSSQHIQLAHGQTPSSVLTSRTEYYTPGFAMTPLDEGDSTGPQSGAGSAISASSDNAFVHRHHHSAPPLPLSQQLLDAHSQHAKSIQAEKDRAMQQVGQMELEIESLRRELKALRESNARARRQSIVPVDTRGEEQLRLEKLELEDLKDELDQQEANHKEALEQLQGAVTENEEYFDTLQIAHDDLAERLSSLEVEYSQALERVEQLEQEAADARALRKEVTTLQTQNGRHELEKSAAQSAIVELQASITKAETELASAEDAQTERSGHYEAVISTLKDELAIQTARVEEVEDLLKIGIEREAELARLTKAIKVKDERIIDLQTRQTQRQQDLSKLRDEAGEKDGRIASLESRLEESEHDIKQADADLKNALRTMNAKESIIAVLRDKLRTINYATDEKIAKGQMEVKRLEGLLVEAESALEEANSREKEAISQLEPTRDERDELAGRNQVLEEDLAGLREDYAELTDKLAESESILRMVEEEKEELEGAKMSLEQEKQELLDLLNSTAGDDESLSGLQQQLIEARGQLAHSNLRVRSMETELADVNSTLKMRSSTISVQDGELDFLRESLRKAEEKLEMESSGDHRKLIDLERLVETLSGQVEDLQTQLHSRDEAITSAITSLEVEKSTSADLKSRLNTYTSEIDRLSLANANLTKTIEDIRRDSSTRELNSVDLEKKVASLEQDKELLNVALDSKQTELILLQRQLGTGTPRPQSSKGLQGASLAASTGRTNRASMSNDVTPMPTRRLSQSLSQSSLRTGGTKRDSLSSIPASPMVTPTQRARSSMTPTPLGPSVKHNRTPERRAAGKMGKPTTPTAPTVSQLGRRTSLPVLKGRNSADLGKSMSISRSQTPQLAETDESGSENVA